MKKKEKDVNYKVHIGPVAEVVLTTIALAGVVTLAVCAPNAMILLKPFLKEKKYSPKRAVNKSIESLVRTGLVEKKINENGEVTLELTKRGRWESLIRGNLEKKPVWDNKWRIVIFDVPDTKSKLRDELRRGMRLYGFQLLQKSVWIYPYPCDDFVKIIREYLEIKEDVLQVTAVSFEQDKMYRKLFKL